MNYFADYDSWKSLNVYLKSLTLSNKEKLAGDIFENLCKYYLQTTSQYKSKLKNVWLIKEIPEKIKTKLNLPDRDEGIDLIVQTKENNFWSIQAKYRSDNKTRLSIKGDLSTFANLSFNNCKHITHGIVFTTTDKPPLKSVLLKNIGFETLRSFQELDENNFEGWNIIKNHSQGRHYLINSKKPKDHQLEALRKTIKYLADHERGKILMPCGTGKSLLSFWIAKELKAKKIIVAVPSLSLLQQTLKVWTREFLSHDINPDWLCVCSDKSVSEDLDDFVDSSSEMGFHVTTDVNEVSDWLKSKNNQIKIIFTTYHSSLVMANGSKNIVFDLAIFDEAHKTVGHESKVKSHLINENNIKIKKRIFMTATERLFKRHKADYLSMDNKNAYGETIYQMSFKEAISTTPKIICDYKIITFEIKSQDIANLNKNNDFIDIKDKLGIDVSAREFATSISLRKAIKKHKIRKILTFHRSIKRAKDFKKHQEYVSDLYNENIELETFHINGSMTSNERYSIMNSFEQSNTSIITNARCLTEGVDMPAVDCVVFTDPKKSIIDIVQAAGRTLRMSPGKKYGYILVPIYIPNEEDPQFTAREHGFEDVVSVVGSLSLQDSRIVEYFKLIDAGKIPNRGTPVDDIIDTKNIVKVDPDYFAKSLKIKIWDKIARANLANYLETKKYARSLKYKSRKEWDENVHKLPKNITKYPEGVFSKYNVWEGWREFLGYKGRQYRSYLECKKYAQSLNLKTYMDWNSKINKLPRDIPRSIQRIYPDEWEGWGEFLGTKNIPTSDIYKNKKKTQKKRVHSIYKNYQDTKKYARSLQYKSRKEWDDKAHKLPEDIIKTPEHYFNQTGEWEGWREFLGYKGRQYRSYLECKKYAQSLNIKSSSQWVSAKNKLPKDVPKNIENIYPNEWEGWGIFLGTGNIATNKKEK